MKDASDPFTIAEQLLGNLALSVGQLAQLRALNTKYWTAVFALKQGETGTRTPSEEELSTLRRTIEADIFEILTPEQRAAVSGAESGQD
ncbi:MAG TPA: hypothetical protein VJ672_12880 [Gemmatimonadaceae bacterium]|nr:hypothetical protein [Gemmatimonadaceae bacterium]